MMGRARPRPSGAAPPPPGAVVYFDGVCALCNGFVDWVMVRDRAGLFRFAPLQGQTAREQLWVLPMGDGVREAVFGETAGGKSAPLPGSSASSQTAMRTVVLVDESGVALRSTAVLRILEGLGGVWRLAAVLRLCPAPLRDLLYDAVAKRRYGWFGKRETCRIPTGRDAGRILP